MRTFSTAGYKFYMLDRGERAPDPYSSRDVAGAYLIWPRKSGKWDTRIFHRGQWTEFTDRQFDTENEAFNFAYDHYGATQNRFTPRD